MDGRPKGVGEGAWGGRPVVRPLIPVTLALMAGIAAPAWGVTLPWPWPAVGLVCLWLALALTWWLVPGSVADATNSNDNLLKIRFPSTENRKPKTENRIKRLTLLLPLIFFWLLGVAFYQRAWEPAFPPHHIANLPQEEEMTLWGRLHRPSKMGGERVQLFVEVAAWHGPGGWRPAAGRLLVSAPPLEPPPVGTPVVVRGRLRAPQALKNPGAFNRPRHLAADGIFRLMPLKDRGRLVFLAATEGYPLGEKLRGGIRQLLKDLPPTPRAIFLSMLLGDQGEITPAVRQALARTGTSHLLVINGLHLSMVAAVAYFLVFWALRRSAWLLLRLNAVKVATLLAAGPVVIYAWIAGGSPSTQRAEVMVLSYLLLLYLGRPREVWSALALAGLIILCLTPLRLFSVSFQLSFAAVAALIYFIPRWFGEGRERSTAGGWAWDWGSWLWRRAKEALAVSTVASLATAPIVAWYFQVVSLFGILVNLVAIPLVLGLALPLGEAAVFAQALSLTSLAKVLLSLGYFPLWLGYRAIEGAAGLPGSAITVPIPTYVQIIGYYLFLVLLFPPWRWLEGAGRQVGGGGQGPVAQAFSLWEPPVPSPTPPPPTPYGFKVRGHIWRWAGIMLVLGIMLGNLAWPHLRPPKSLEVTCLDTYGGLSGVVVTPEGRRLAVSAGAPGWAGGGGGGGSPGPLPAYLHWRQWRGLDLVAALSLNHRNAPELLTLARQFEVGAWWYGTRGSGGEAYWELWNRLGDQGRAPRSLDRGGPPGALGGVGLSFPRLGRDQGVALLLTYEGRGVLLLPPLKRFEALELTPSPAPGVEALIMPAGIEESAGWGDLLDRLKPQRLVIYGGRPDNLPGYFAQDGAVSVFLGAGGVKVEQWRR